VAPKRRAALLLSAGLLAEIVALAIALEHAWIALVVHLVGVAPFALGLLASLPRPYGAPSRIAAGVLGAIALFMPVLGMLGLVIVFPIAIARQKPYVELPWQEVQVPDLPYKPLFLGETPVRAAEGALAEVLRHATDPDKRVAAVMALRHMDDRLAMPLLRIALKDPVDDVRLLAYAMLDKKDQTIAKRIQERQAALVDAPERQKFFLRRYLAQDFWEMAYLGLATGDVLGYVLEQSATHLLEALTIREDAGARFLLGRIRLRQGRADEAEAELLRAQAGGLPDPVVLPYLAEAAFIARQYGAVKERLGRLEARFVKRPPLDAVVAYWAEAETERA
jgi:polysaccharide biosynthesis protein PelE